MSITLWRLEGTRIILCESLTSGVRTLRRAEMFVELHENDDLDTWTRCCGKLRRCLYEIGCVK